MGRNVRLSTENLVNISKRLSSVDFDTKTKNLVNSSRKIVEKCISDKKIVYGVTTGFGSFKNKLISKENLEELQINLIRSHACGVGEPFTEEETRAMLTVRLNSLIQGYSGVSYELVTLVKDIINSGITPIVPSQGSVGASGDLAPLCHMGLVLAGEGEAIYNGKKIKGSVALKKLNLKPITFKAKEGLAWSNGTSVMTGLAGLSIEDCKTLIKWADIACALSFEALRGCTASLDPKIHEVRGQIGQIIIAKNMRKLLAGSKLASSDLSRVQDSYTLRCTPQVHGAALDVFLYAKKVIEIELNAVTDNPVVFPNGEILSGGNFHGEPVAMAVDSLAIAMSELGSISERRTAKMIDPANNHNLPAFLINPKKAGLCSGLMIPQYVAAALVSENKILSHPACVDSIPTSANQEDHVSMGTIGARKLRSITENVKNILAIEILNACQAIDFVDKNKLSPETKKIYNLVRKHVSYADSDRVFSIDILKIADNIII